MSARAWKRRRAKATARDPAVQQWFKDVGDKIASELSKYRWVGPWRLSMHGLPVYTSSGSPQADEGSGSGNSGADIRT